MVTVNQEMEECYQERQTLHMDILWRRTPTGRTHTLEWNVQMVLPGGTAPSHRHTPTAIRDALHSQGATTMVNGKPLTMHPGDLILTPNWCWHGHTNDTHEPAACCSDLDWL